MSTMLHVTVGCIMLICQAVTINPGIIMALDHKVLMLSHINVSAGVWYDDLQSVNLAKEIASRSCLTFKGLYIHEGDSYKCRGEDEIKQSASETFKRLNIFSSR